MHYLVMRRALDQHCFPVLMQLDHRGEAVCVKRLILAPHNHQQRFRVGSQGRGAVVGCHTDHCSEAAGVDGKERRHVAEERVESVEPSNPKWIQPFDLWKELLLI